MKTHQPGKAIAREWHFFDAKGKVLGRLATEVAGLLMGKGKRDFVTNRDLGDYVVVTNASLVKVTGNKMEGKVYYSHSGYPGGLKKVHYSKLIKEQPEKVIEKAVKGMLPKNKLQSPRMNRLKVFSSEDHPYQDKIKKDGKES